MSKEWKERKNIIVIYEEIFQYYFVRVVRNQGILIWGKLVFAPGTIAGRHFVFIELKAILEQQDITIVGSISSTSVECLLECCS